MGEAARTLDTLELGRIYTANDAAAYEARFAGVGAPELLHG
jgi:phosphoadenosine phosphosulfate reductase